jgi:hypothetical protein
MVKLNDVEMFWIANHINENINDIIAKFPHVDSREIEAFVNNNKNSNVDTSTSKVHDPEAFITGNLMARREGIVVMTKNAAELSDARRTLVSKPDPNYAEKNSDKIHKIFKNKK